MFPMETLNADGFGDADPRLCKLPALGALQQSLGQRLMHLKKYDMMRLLRFFYLSIYIYIYIYMWKYYLTYIYIYIWCMYVYIYIYLYVYIYIYMYDAYIHIYIYTTWLNVCISRRQFCLFFLPAPTSLIPWLFVHDAFFQEPFRKLDCKVVWFEAAPSTPRRIDLNNQISSHQPSRIHQVSPAIIGWSMLNHVRSIPLLFHSLIAGPPAIGGKNPLIYCLTVSSRQRRDGSAMVGPESNGGGARTTRTTPPSWFIMLVQRITWFISEKVNIPIYFPIWCICIYIYINIIINIYIYTIIYICITLCMIICIYLVYIYI